MVDRVGQSELRGFLSCSHEAVGHHHDQFVSLACRPLERLDSTSLSRSSVGWPSRRDPGATLLNSTARRGLDPPSGLSLSAAI